MLESVTVLLLLIYMAASSLACESLRTGLGPTPLWNFSDQPITVSVKEVKK